MITLDGMELPEELIWTDEFSWNPVRVNEKISLSGIRNLSESLLPTESGRFITLMSDDAWLDRDDLKTLFSWTKSLSKTMTLVMHDDETYTVRFRHTDPPVLEYEPIIQSAFVDGNTLYRLNIKLEVN